MTSINSKEEMIGAVIVQAHKDVGVEEHPRGSNRGRRVDEMIANTGLSGAYAWCAAAVVTWLVEALGKMVAAIPHSADCDVLLRKAQQQNCLYSNPKIGDIFFRIASATDATHTGLVIEVFRKNGSVYVRTIEGNTNPGGSREGYGVFIRERRIGNLKFFRWVEAIDISILKPTTDNLHLIMNQPDTLWQVFVNEQKFAKIIQVTEGTDTHLEIPIRAFTAYVIGTSLEDAPVRWDSQKKAVMVNGLNGTKWQTPEGEIVAQKEMGVPVNLRNGVGWSRVRDAVGALGLTLVIDPQMKQVHITTQGTIYRPMPEGVTTGVDISEKMQGGGN